MSSESSTDTRYIDKLATDLTRADIRAKCATAAEHNGRKYFGIYNGNICKFGTTLENEFFYTKNLKSFDSSSCFRDSSGRPNNLQLFPIHLHHPILVHTIQLYSAILNHLFLTTHLLLLTLFLTYIQILMHNPSIQIHPMGII